MFQTLYEMFKINNGTYEKTNNPILTIRRSINSISVRGYTFTKIDLSRCSLKTFSGKDLLYLEELVLYSNNLKTFAANSFPKLKKLDVSFNKLKSIEFDTLPNLEELEVSGNRLEVFKADSLPKLAELDLSDTDLVSFSGYKFPSLVKLIMIESRIKEFKDNDLPSLRLLKIADCTLSSLDVTDFPRLVKLFLGGGKLGLLRATKLEHLKYLEIERCKIEKFELEDLGKLKYVDIAYSNIARLTRIKNTPNLRTLGVNNTSFEKFSVKNQPNLKTLDLSRVKANLKIKNVPKLKNLNLFACETVSYVDDLPSLVSLNVNRGELEIFKGSNFVNLTQLSLPSGVQEFTGYNLQHLISFNVGQFIDDDFSELVTFSSNTLPSLEKLGIRRAMLQDFSDNHLPKLKELRFHDTSLTTVARNYLPLVEEFYVINCRYFENLDQDLPSLKSIDLRSTPVRMVDQAIWDTLPTMIKPYVRIRLHRSGTKTAVDQLLPFPIAEEILPEMDTF